MKRKLFQQNKQSRTIDLDTSHIVLFKLPCDSQQIALISRQLTNTPFLRESYELAPKQTFGHILINLGTKTSNVLRYSYIIVPPGPSNFYYLGRKLLLQT